MHPYKEQGMVLPIVLLIMMLVSSIAIQVISDAIGSNKGMLSFMAYLQRLYQAENKLIQMEEAMKNKFLDMKQKHDSIMPLNRRLPEEIEMMGFVPDHLEFGCQTGVYILKLESSPLIAHWALPLD